MGLGNGDWITGRMERHGELRYMMNGHYDIDFLSSSLSINRDSPDFYLSTMTEHTNKRTRGGFICLGDHPPLFLFLLRDEWTAKHAWRIMERKGARGARHYVSFDSYFDSTLSVQMDRWRCSGVWMAVMG